MASAELVRFADTSDDSRWALMITVRPRAIRAMLVLTIASLSASSALVASSRIRMRGSRISARDRDALALSAGEVGRPLVDLGVVAARCR